MRGLGWSLGCSEVGQVANGAERRRVEDVDAPIPPGLDERVARKPARLTVSGGFLFRRLCPKVRVRARVRMPVMMSVRANDEGESES